MKISHGYGVPSKSYGVSHKGYGIPKGIPLFRWDSPHPHYKVKGAVHHAKHGYPVKFKHHHGKNVVHVIKVNHHHVKPVYVKPAVSIPASTVSSAGYGSTSSSAVSNHHPPITHSSGYTVTTNNKGQASAYGLNKKPFTAFKLFNKGVAGSPAVIKDPVAPVIDGEVLPIAEVAPPVINVPAAVEVVPVVPEVVAPVVVVPEVVPAKEESPLSAEIVAGAEPQSAEEEQEVESVSAEIAPPPESPESPPPPVENVVVQPEADPLPVEEIAAEPVISETVPVDPVEISEIEVEIVEIATDVAISAPVEEVESVTEIDQQQKDQIEDEKADGGANKGSEEEEEGNSEERS